MDLAEFRMLTAHLPGDIPILVTSGSDLLAQAAMLTKADLVEDDPLLDLLEGNEIIIEQEA